MWPVLYAEQLRTQAPLPNACARWGEIINFKLSNPHVITISKTILTQANFPFTMEVRLYIIQTKRKWLVRILQYSLIGCITLMISSFVFFNLYLFLPSTFSALIILIILSFSKDIERVGYLLLNNDNIVVNTMGQYVVHKAESISQLTIVIRELAGENYLFNPQSFEFTKGRSNYIKIQKANSVLSFEVLLEKHHLGQLDRLAKLWEKKGTLIIFIDKWGKEKRKFSK